MTQITENGVRVYEPEPSGEERINLPFEYFRRHGIRRKGRVIWQPTDRVVSENAWQITVRHPARLSNAGPVLSAASLFEKPTGKVADRPAFNHCQSASTKRLGHERRDDRHSEKWPPDKAAPPMLGAIC